MNESGILLKPLPNAYTSGRQANFESVRLNIVARMARKTAPRAIFWDLDGVLADSWSANAQTVREVLDGFGFGARREIEKTCMGSEPKAILRILVPELEDKPELLDRMAKRMNEICDKNTWMITPTPLVGLVSALSGSVKQALATNRNDTTHILLAKFEIRRFFNAVLTPKEAAPKPSPEMLNMALEVTGVGAREALFVGDGSGDRQASKDAGIPFIHVSWR